MSDTGALKVSSVLTVREASLMRSRGSLVLEGINVGLSCRMGTIITTHDVVVSACSFPTLAKTQTLALNALLIMMFVCNQRSTLCWSLRTLAIWTSSALST
jgi:hypothetical protein